MLDFTGNKLKKINEGVFNGLNFLKELILTSNRIEFIELNSPIIL
jgi:hypothetical protein